MKKYLAALFLALSLFVPSTIDARFPRGGTAPGTTGQTQLNLDVVIPAHLTNILKVASPSFSGGADPGPLGAKFDANGYPTQAFTGAINLLNSTATDTYVGGVSYTFIWTAGTKLGILQNVASSGCSFTGSGGSVSGCSNNNATLTIDGTGAGTMTITPSNGFSLFWVSGASYGAAGTANLALVRTSDVAAYQNATYVANNDARADFTPEVLSVYTALKLKAWRNLGWNNTNFNNVVQPQYSNAKTSFTWFGANYPPSVWGGAITGTNVYTSPAAPDTPLGGWVDGEVLQGTIANAPTQISISGAVNNGSGLCRLTVSSATTITTGDKVWSLGINGATSCNGKFTAVVIDPTHIDLTGSTFSGTYSASGAVLGTQTLAVTGKAGGSKFMCSRSGYPIYATSDSFTPGIATLSFIGLLDCVMYSTGGITGAAPVQVQASMANYLNANLWYVYPATASNSLITDIATKALTYLKPGLKFMPEYCNECWNFQFQATYWAGNVGQALGFPTANLEDVHGWYGLRTKQMSDLVASVWSGRMSDLRRVLAYQGPADVPQIKKWRMEGFDLAPSGVSTGIGNALYCTYTGGTFSGTCTGGADYTTFPNRPIDGVETSSYAPYQSGNNFSDQGLNGGTTASANNAAFLQTLATAFAANPNDPTALSLFDQDQRGLITSPGATISVTCPTGNTFTAANQFLIPPNGALSRVVFSVTGGTVCNGLTAGQVYCIAASNGSTFSVAAFQSDGTCGSAISVTPGTGSVTVGPINANNLATLAASVYPKWENNAASYDAARLGAGKAPLRVEWYEGSSESVPPSSAQLAALGVTVGGSSVTAANALAAGATAWRNNALSTAFIQNGYYGLFEAFPHSKTPSNLTMGPGPYPNNPYALITGALPDSTPYTGIFNGVAGFVGVP